MIPVPPRPPLYVHLHAFIFQRLLTVYRSQTKKKMTLKMMRKKKKNFIVKMRRRIPIGIRLKSMQMEAQRRRSPPWRKRSKTRRRR
jgi:uncharacterized lipoprotein YddW (UPF0748 family)